MTEQNENVTHEGPQGKYFHQMLNLYDDELDPFQYRLLGHYIRVCGAQNNACKQGTRRIAEITHMSVGSVSEVRAQLEAMGYIRVEMGSRGLLHVTIVDKMMENVARYSGSTVHHMNTTVHQVNERRTREEELKDSSPAGDKGDNLSATDHATLLKAIEAVFGVKGVARYNYVHMLRGTAKKENTAWWTYQLPAEDPVAPDELIRFGEWWSREHGGEIRRPEIVHTRILEWRENVDRLVADTRDEAAINREYDAALVASVPEEDRPGLMEQLARSALCDFVSPGAEVVERYWGHGQTQTRAETGPAAADDGGGAADLLPPPDRGVSPAQPDDGASGHAAGLPAADRTAGGVE